LTEKRTILFLMLAAVVWASIASSSMAYYYLEQTRYKGQNDEMQQLLNGIAENYNSSLTKQDSLSRDYNTLLGEYYQFFGDNYSQFMSGYKSLLSSLEGNYTSALNKFPELKEAYNNLLNNSQALSEKNVVTGEEFDSLLKDYYRLFMSLAAKELEDFLNTISTIEVTLCIDYGNETQKWHNLSASSGKTLFDLTLQIAKVDYDYYSLMEPGHMLINSIDDLAPSGGKYWFWYYWDGTKNEWIRGQIGCDAWLLKDNGIYKWAYKTWEP
jgi:hypothetical protein